MNITKETIEHIAHLARLPMTADDSLLSDISGIIEYMNTVPTALDEDAPADLSCVLREDEVGKCLPSDALDSMAFSVPKAVQ